MFVLKFYQDTEDGSVQTTVCGERFEVFKRKNGNTTVTVFMIRDGTVIEGTDYHISQEHYKSCFVENSLGKTIQHIKP